MRYVLVTLSGGIIERVALFDSAKAAVKALSDHVRRMDPEKDDAEVFGPEGLIACAKDFLDEDDGFIEREDILCAPQEEKPIYLIGNPSHRLGFMVASSDDPLGYEDPAEALSVLETLREDFGNHLKLYRAIPVESPVVTRDDLERFHRENDVDDFGPSLVEEYLL
jgi:hypothetical protein